MKLHNKNYDMTNQYHFLESMEKLKLLLKPFSALMLQAGNHQISKSITAVSKDCSLKTWPSNFREACWLDRTWQQ